MIRALKWIGGGVALLLLGIAALLLVADTGTGHRFITDRIARLKVASGLQVRIGRIDGSIYGRARLHDLRLLDSRGVFFEAGDVALDWTPRDWLANRLDITSITAPSASLFRLPALKPTGRRGAILPSFDIRIGRLLIDRLSIGTGVSGKPHVGRLVGRADIRDGRAFVDLGAATSAGDRLLVKLDIEPKRNVFDVAADVNAPAGGTFGALIGTQRPATARLTGKGDWRSWNGTLAATASGTRVISLDLAAHRGRYDLAGQLAPSIVTKGKLMRLSAPVVRVKGNAMLASRRLDTHLSLASPALAIGANGILDLGTSSFRNFRLDAHLLRPPALLPNMTGRNIRLGILLDGTFASASFDYLLTAERAAFDRTGFENVRAAGHGHLSKSPILVPLKLTARRVTGVGDVAGGILANLSVDGVLKVTSKLVTGDAFRLRSDKLTSRVTLVLDLVTGRYDVGLTGQLGRYLIPGLGIVDVKSELRVVPGPNGHGTRIVGRGHAWVRRLDNAFLASLAGGLPRIETDLERSSDGIIHFVGLRLTAPSIGLTGNGYRRRDGSFYFEGAGTQARYGPVRMTLDGKIDRPRLDLRLARPMDTLGLANVHALLDPTPLGYAWRAAGGSRLGPFTADGTILLPRGASTTIGIAALDVSGLRGQGSFRSLPGGFLGRLALGGSGITGTLDFAPAGGIQRIEAHLAARNARLAGPPAISVGRGKLDAVMLLDPAGTGIDATATAQALSYGNIYLARLAGHAGLRAGRGEVRAAFAGSRGRAFDLQTVAQVAPDRIALTGGGTVDRQPIRLDGPAVLTRTADGWALGRTTVSFAGGTASVAGHYGAQATDVDATLVGMPLTVLDIAYPRLALGGIASGTFAFGQPSDGSAPTGSADLRIRGLTRAGLVLSSRPIDVGVSAILSGNGAVMRAVAASDGKVIGRAQGRVAPLAARGSLVERMQNAPLLAQIRYNGPADTLWRLTGIESFDISGPLAVGADMGGSLANPEIRGSLRTDGLRLESPLSGTLLTNMKATGRFGGSRLQIDNFSAAAGKGTVSGRAAFTLGRLLGIDIAADAADADLLRRDDIAATVTGPLTIKSDGMTGVIGGNVVLNRSAFHLGQASAAAAVPRLRVREINQLVDEEQPRAPAMPWRLDLKARAPNRVAVTGLGLDSEWRADLALGGTIDSPAITGRADLVRGGYEFAGRRFDLQRGIIRFQGASPPDPLLDIEADANISDLSATIKVTGTGQKPEISFTSVPALPQDELLSRLLFGTSITNLSAPEALQLAAAVASLRGGGGGLNPINAVRQAVGLDRLRILPADTTTGQKTSIAAGKYITRRTYVEVISDGAGYSATRVEFQITRWLSLLSTISTIGRQSATVRVSKDY